MTARPPRLVIAANNGEVGGGEVMLLRIADALRELGLRVVVLAPGEPRGIAEAAAAEGHEVEIVPAHDRPSYMASLAAWRLRHRRVPLWCNGLVPSLATAGMGPRIVHLHLLPHGAHRAAARIARTGAASVLVPSEFMARHVRGARVLANWTEDLSAPPVPELGGEEFRIGFLGRLTRDKGVDVLAQAVRLLDQWTNRPVRLVLAGENRFGSVEDDRALESALDGWSGGVDRIGWVDRARFFRSVDLAVFPSVFPEPFGLVAAEAMSARVPFVISDAGGLPEVAGPRHPWIARRGDPEDLARTLHRAMVAPPRTIDDQLTAARDRWSAEYSPAAGRARVRDLLVSLTTESPR